MSANFLPQAANGAGADETHTRTLQVQVMMLEEPGECNIFSFPLNAGI
jgi:hypothetical protein